MRFYLGQSVSNDHPLKNVLEKFHSPKNDDLMVVMGGDGSMLEAVKKHGPGHIYLGLNYGTLGFLMNEVGDDQISLIEAIEQGSYSVRPFPRLQMETDTGKTDLALNDVYMERASGQTARLRIEVDGECIVEKLVCDGVIVSTALGSTAYNVSAGGPTSHPFVSAIYLTPIAPHTPRLRPVVLPPDVGVDIYSVGDPDTRPVRVLADGRGHGKTVRTEICKADDIHLAFFKEHSFTRALVQKVLLS